MPSEKSKSIRNVSMLYLMSIAKMIFPLITLPYLTRILSTDAYGVVSYVKAVMSYMQLILIFGFTLSATKDIVYAHGEKRRIGEITGNVLIAKAILAGFCGTTLVFLIYFTPILNENGLFTWLSFLNVVLTEMLVDFLFRGLDKMEVITSRFVISKIISTVFTFILVKNDADILLIPILDIIGTLFALVLVQYEIHKLKIVIRFTSLSESIKMLKDSGIYFLSEMATTAFGALNTVLVGILVSKTEVAYWSLVMQLIAAVQSMYTPIINGIYPSMLRVKKISFINKISLVFMPIVLIGCVICYFGSGLIVSILGGPQYLSAARLFRFLIPVLFFSFPSMLYGWPALGPIHREKETTTTTILTAVAQIAGLVILIITNSFTLINLAILRGLTEALLLFLRLGVCYRFRYEYGG